MFYSHNNLTLFTTHGTSKVSLREGESVQRHRVANMRSEVVEWQEETQVTPRKKVSMNEQSLRNSYGIVLIT